MNLKDFLSEKMGTFQNAKYIETESEITIRTTYYTFIIKKNTPQDYAISYFWKLGILGVFFKERINEMHFIHDLIIQFCKLNNIVYEVLVYNKTIT